jgi:cell wall assembly regulator SMI1
MEETMAVVWDFVDAPFTRETIQHIERIFEVKFPEDYVMTILKYHGGSPEPNVYDFEGRVEAVFGYLLSYDPKSINYIVKIYSNISDRLEQGIIPIADDPFGNYICLDFRGKEPRIVFWDHEVARYAPNRALAFICENFTDLLHSLYFYKEEI